MIKPVIYILILHFFFITLYVNAKKYDQIFISPHIDDAVFSCGGLISKFVNKKQNVLVVTFYNKQPDSTEIPKKYGSIIDYKIRMKNDSAALNFLQVDYNYLNLKERAFISPPLKKASDVFKSPLEGTKGYARMDSIAIILEEYIIHNPDARLYVPVGAGNQYDNTEIFLAAVQLVNISNFQYKIFFYEDAYVLLGNRIREKHFVINKVLYDSKTSPEKTSFFLRGKSKDISSSIQTESIRDDYKSLTLFIKWNLIKIELTQDDIDNKISAISKYNSEVDAYGGILKLEKAVKVYYKFWENNEPLWQIIK